MPALITHDYFGRDVHARLTDSTLFFQVDDSLKKAAFELFLIGCQGPDPFFFVQMTPTFKLCKQFGSLMHIEKVEEAIESLRRIALSLPVPKQQLVAAYLSGFLCHYTLDSIMHPFVYAHQTAICNAGVKGLDSSDGRAVHAQIEADLDMMLLHQRKGVGLREYNYTQDVLRADDEGLALINNAYLAMAHEVYALDLPSNAFLQGVKDMRLTIRAFYSPRGIKRSFLGKFERIFARHSFVQALSPRFDVGTTCDYDNREHAEWIDPFFGVAHTTSFSDLFEAAVERAVRNIEALWGGAPVQEITNGINFEGSNLPQ